MCSNEELIAPPLDELGQAELRIKELEDNVNAHNSNKYYFLKQYAISGIMVKLDLMLETFERDINNIELSINELSSLCEKTNDLFTEHVRISNDIFKEKVEQNKKSSYNCDKE